MRFDNTTIRILVRKNYGECFDFYTDKIGLTPVWGDRNGPYTSFAVEKDAPHKCGLPTLTIHILLF